MIHNLALVLIKVKDKVVEARRIKDRNLSIEGYLEGLKNDMLENNEGMVDLTHATIEIQYPIFFK
jgi:hypothetical protein